MNIYAILSTKPHNPHYLNRYIKFIQACQLKNVDFEGYVEKHHICPKSKNMFPKYKNLNKYPWNEAILTARQHFIAHWILWKVYPNNKSVCYAFWQMTHRNNYKPDSKTYAILSEERSNSIGEINRKKVKDGTHHFLGGEIQRNVQRKRIENDTHHWLNGPLRIKNEEKRLKNLKNSTEKRVKDGTHHFLGGEIQSKTNRKRVEDGTHPWLGGEQARKINQKRIEEGTHNWASAVTCYDRQGNCVGIPKEVYYNQTGPKENWEFVHVSSREARKRKGDTEQEDKINYIRQDFLESGLSRKEYAALRNINRNTLKKYLRGL